MKNVIPSFTLTVTDSDIEVRCAECNAVLDRVPDERTAYWRAGKYAEHHCVPSTEPLRAQ